MDRENLDRVIVTLAALVIAVVALFWPTQAGTIGALITNAILPVVMAIVAILYPAGKAVEGIYAARSRLAYYGAVRAGKLPPPRGEVMNTAQSDVDKLLQSIYAELDGDGISYKDEQGNIDPVPVAPRLARELANRWNDETQGMGFRQVLLQTTINMASASFTASTNLPAPSKYDEVAAPQTYWLNHKVQCAVHSAGLFHQILMPLRTALKIRDTGGV